MTEQTGDVLNVAAADVFPGVEIYGQHEISELTKSPGEADPAAGAIRGARRFRERNRKQELRQELERSRSRILAAREELTPGSTTGWRPCRGSKRR